MSVRASASSAVPASPPPGTERRGSDDELIALGRQLEAALVPYWQWWHVEAAGVMSNDDAFVDHFLRVVDDVGERYWRLPLYDDYDRQMKIAAGG